jgi:hypothetical protein
MRKLNNPMPSGGAPFTNEDFSDVFQTEIWAALQGLLSQYDADAEGVIVSGCVVTPNVGNFDMTAGIVYLNGEFMRVDAVTNQTFTKYIKASAVTNVSRVFNDAASKTFIIEKKAEVSATVDAGGQEITISSVAASNDRRFSVATATKLGLTKLYANVAASNTDGAVTQDALVTALNLKADKVQPAWTDIVLNSDWEKYPTGQTPQWRVDQFGKIELRGEVRTKTATASSQFISPAISGRALATNRVVIFLKPYTAFGGGGYSGNAAVSLESDGAITIAKSPFPTWSGATIDVGNLSLEGMIAWP